MHFRVAPTRVKRVGQVCGMAVLASWVAVLLIAVAVGAEVQLTFTGHWSGATQVEVQQLIDDYRATSPGTSIEYLQVGVPNYMEKLAIMKASGVTPDVLSVPASWIPELVDLQILAPVPALFENSIRQVYLPQAINFALYRGRLYGYPTENMVSALLFNGELLDMAGLARESPASWTALPGLARKLTVTGADGAPLQVGFGLPKVGSGTPIVALVGSHVWSNGGVLLSSGPPVEPRFDSPEVLSSVDFFCEMIRSGVSTLQGTALNVARKETAIASVRGPFSRREILDKVGENAYAEMGSWASPRGTTGKQVSYQYGWILGVGEGTPNSQEAHRFLSYLTTARNERGATRMGDFYATTGSMPVTKPDLALYQQRFRNEPFMTGFLEALLNSHLETDPRIGRISDLWMILAEQVVAVFQDKATLAQGMADAQRKALAIVRP